VILVQPNDTILSTMSKPFPELAQKHMADIDVQIINNDRVVSQEHGEVRNRYLFSLFCS
jgi:NADH dehydrogenase FAD-containing subunit